MAVGLGSLEIDVLSLILEFVVDTSPATTKSVALVNKHWYSTVTLVGHRQKSIQYFEGERKRGKAGKSTHIEPWLKNEQLLRSVRHLKVEPLHPLRSYEVSVDTEGQDREEQGRCKYHSDPIPAKVLAALHKNHKRAELKVWDWHRWDSSADEHDPSEVALSQSPALTMIRASIWNHGAGIHPDLREVAFKRIVATAPNLRSASVITGHSGCIITSLWPDQLQEINRMAHLFYTHKQPNDALRHLTLDGYGLTENNLRSWSEFVNLSQLTSLKCSRGMPDNSYFSYAPAVLTSLKSVSLNLSHHDVSLRRGVENYICSCAPLESLSLWSWQGVISLSSILDVHGPTLKTLQLHERETTARDKTLARKLLTIDELKQINAACPKLEDFTFDLDRHTRGLESELEDAADIFNIVAEMKLDKLQIYYDLGLAHLDGPYGSVTRPLVIGDGSDDSKNEDEDDGDAVTGGRAQNEKAKSPTRTKSTRPSQPLSPTPNKQISNYASRLWKKIFGETRVGPRTLDLKFGEWERKMGTGYPALWVIEEQRLKTHWTVNPKERSDMLGECNVKQKGEGYEELRGREVSSDVEELFP